MLLYCRLRKKLRFAMPGRSLDQIRRLNVNKVGNENEENDNDELGAVEVHHNEVVNLL